MKPNRIYIFLNQFLGWQNHFQSSVGHGVAWLTLLLVVLASLGVALRYGFDFSSPKLDESLLYVHGLIFMLGLAYTYQQNQHVRVDVFYEHASQRRKNWVNLLGAVFFVLPMMAFIIWAGWDYVAASWSIQERSADASGLAYVYLLKSVILISAGLVLLQTLAFIVQYSLALFAADQLNPQAKANAFQDNLQEGV